MAGNNEPPMFKKTISKSTNFLRNIWYIWNNVSPCDEQDISQTFSHVQDSEEVTTKRSDIAANLSPRNDIKTDNTESDIQNRKKPNRRTQTLTRNFAPSYTEGFVEDVSNQPLNRRFVHDISMTDSRWTPERLLTEDFLDKVLISKVEQKKKWSYFYMQSRVLYKYLSYHLGSERMIQIRRKVSKFSEQRLLYQHDEAPIQISGSRAEGLDMSGSDIDYMISCMEAYEDTVDRQGYWTFDSLEYIAIPGYVTMKIGKTECISSSLFTRLLQRIGNSFTLLPPSISTHGPSILHSLRSHDYDFVCCCKCPTWPNIAEEWKHRIRKFGWPSEEMISNIVLRGCHIVPVCSKIEKINGTEWRLSFSMAEKQLVWSFNHVQILIYGLLKLLLKEVIEEEEILKDLLCSYFLKTTLFWVIEETNGNLWNPKYTVLCFCICLDRLIKFVIEENCPNYFVPINNMFLERFTQNKREALLHFLCGISEQGLSWVVKSQTMSKLLPYIEDPYTVTSMLQLQEIKEEKEVGKSKYNMIIKCVELTALIYHVGVPYHARMYIKEYAKDTSRLPLLTKSAVHNLSHFIDTQSSHMNNKEKYVCKQLVLNLILHGSEYLSIYKNSMLASWLYGQHKFKDCLTVIDAALIDVNSKVLNWGAFEISELRQRVYSIHQENDLQAFTMEIKIPINSQIAPSELLSVLRCIVKTPIVLRLVKRNPMIFDFLPKSYFYFLQCICYLRLGDSEGFDKSIGELRNIRFIDSESDEEEKSCHVMLSILRITAVLANSEKSNSTDKKTLIYNEIIDCCSYNLTRIPDVRSTWGINPGVIDLKEVYRQILYQLGLDGFFH